MDFWDREEEKKQIGGFAGKGAFGYVTGRRRVGKTALLVECCRLLSGLYHQAVEGTPQQQIEHLVYELKDRIPVFQGITPRSWSEFFHLISRSELPGLIVFDEFPYWAESDPALPSLLQKWIDHELRGKSTSLLISGSSQSMLHSYFLNESAPLYGRARLHLNLMPLTYRWFCKVFRFRVSDPEAFERFSMVGGVPHYWNLMPARSLTAVAAELYFRPSAILAEEPRHLLHEEGISGHLPKAILDLVGSGVSKPSEVAARLGMPQSNLSRAFAALLDAGVLHRGLPFGESMRSTKRTLYSIEDPAVRFYYGSFLPFRTRWTTMPESQRKQVVRNHASAVWESFCRNHFPASSRYWEPNLELDLVAPLDRNNGHLVAECKWAKLKKGEEDALLQDLQLRFGRSRLNNRLSKLQFRILSQKDLAEMAP